VLEEALIDAVLVRPLVVHLNPQKWLRFNQRGSSGSRGKFLQWTDELCRGRRAVQTPNESRAFDVWQTSGVASTQQHFRLIPVGRDDYRFGFCAKTHLCSYKVLTGQRWVAEEWQ
jgi:hypothetical protein